jgi:propanol-preferring alcohol dehydrogenase
MSATLPTQMRAARFLGQGRIAIVEKPLGAPGPGEVVVKIHSCALCGSDRGAWDRGSAVTPGHEGSGTVVACGVNTTVPVGTRAALYLVAYCGACRMCRRGETGACLHKERMIGFTHDGAFADYAIVPERCVLPIDAAMDLDLANLLLDVLGTTLHAIRRSHLNVSHPAELSACVMGAGPIGLGSILALQAQGITRIAVVDVIPFRLAMAEEFGALTINASTANPVAVARAHFDGGPDLVIEATGNTRAQRQAIDMAAADGRVVVVGHSSQTLELRTSPDLIAQEKTLIGSEYFGVSEFAENLALVRTGRVEPLKVITHRFPLDQIQQAFEAFWAGETGKVMVYP